MHQQGYISLIKITDVIMQTNGSIMLSTMNYCIERIIIYSCNLSDI